MLRPLLPLIILGAGCASPTVRPRASEPERPEVLVSRLRRALRQDRWSRAFELLSQRSQDELGPIKFRLGFPELGVPGTGLRIIDVLREGEVVGVLPYSPDAKARRERRASKSPPRRCLVSFIAADEKERWSLQFLILREGPGGGTWRLAMAEQTDIELPVLIGPAPRKKG